jgi:alpha-beta hydrolase superfamily lysophospholipase/molecular chaperone GrpE (heat shock protein)
VTPAAWADTAYRGVDVEIRRPSGMVLCARRWDPDAKTPVQGRVVIVHGLGEHGGRYPTLVNALCAAGFRVVSYDQRGHGRSPGKRGVASELSPFLDDLVGVGEWAQQHLPGPAAPIVYGHSFGGLVTLRTLQTRRFRWAAAVLSAPWLATAVEVPEWKRLLAPILGRLAPEWTLGSGLDPGELSRDAAVVEAYIRDPLVHDRVSAGLVATVEAEQAAARAQPLPEGLPALMLLPGADRIAESKAAAEWAQSMAGPGLEVSALEGRRHEPHNDHGRDEVFERVVGWLKRHRGSEQGREEWVSCSFGRRGPEGSTTILDDAEGETAMTDPTSPDTPDLSDLESAMAVDAETAAQERGSGPTPEEVEEALIDAELSSDMQTMEDELAILNDRHLRLAAEFTNYRRRVEGEKSGTWDRAQADLVRKFVEVLDDLQRVALLDPADEAVTVQSIVEGIDLVERKFMRALEDAGAEILTPDEGAAFDPEMMEAMMRVPVEDSELDDTVASVFAKGYTFRGHLVRPVRVSVHKAD